VICATPTLAVGVNLPSRRTIIKGTHRYVSGLGMKPVSVMEYKQMRGRAGRPKYDKFGEAILFAKNKNDMQNLFNDFIFADTEPIQSNLGTESALRVHILSSICTGFITSLKSAFQFIEKTFFSYTEKHYDLSEMIIEIIDFLEKEEMIQIKNNIFLPTAFGSRISRLYIDPISAVIIRDCLTDINVHLQPLTLLFLICSVPDMITLALNKSDIDKIMPFANENKDKFELPLMLNDDYRSYLAKIKTVLMLDYWVNEQKEDLMCDFFNIGPGDIHRFVETASWMMYAAIELAKLSKIKILKSVYQLNIQLRYGIKNELIELVGLKGIGRTRARNLFRGNLKTIESIKKAPLSQIEKIPTIGKELAANIKSQALAKGYSYSLPAMLYLI